MATNNRLGEPLIVSNSSSNVEFYDAESTSDKDIRSNLADDSSIEELAASNLLKQDCNKEPETPANNIDSNTSKFGYSIASEHSKGTFEQESIELPASTIEMIGVNKETSVSSSESALLQDPIWRGHKKHIFVLSEAGKPIYSLNGNEDKLAILYGIIQALVSFVENTQDVLTSIHARGIQFVFMIKSHLIFVVASRTNMSVTQLQMQLNDVHNQILSILTFTQLSKIFQHRKNFDLRRLLEGSERLISNLLCNDSSNKKISNNVFTFLTNSISCLPMPSSTRLSIVSAIKDNCGKIKNLVFAILIAKNRLICLARMKKYSIHQADLRLIFNLVDSTESFKTSENWTPICLPKFNMNGYLHAHVSYLADECPACLLLLTVDRDDFFTLSSAKKNITEKITRSQCLEAINESVQNLADPKYKLSAENIGIPELRHFIYKPKSAAQVLCSEIVHPYTSQEEFERLERIYCDLIERVHQSGRPLKLIFEAKCNEVILAWSTATYELYAVFEPLVKKGTVIKNVDKLIKWIDKEYDTYFIRIYPTF